MHGVNHTYIWQDNDWPDWRYDLTALAEPMADASRAQGLLIGRLADVGLEMRDHASPAVLTDDVVKTSEIEGAQLDVASVRLSGVADLVPCYAEKRRLPRTRHAR